MHLQNYIVTVGLCEKIHNPNKDEENVRCVGLWQRTWNWSSQDKGMNRTNFLSGSHRSYGFFFLG